MVATALAGRFMRLCWVDKVPIFLFGVITVILLVLGQLGGNPDTSAYCHALRIAHPDWTHHDSYCFVTPAQHWSAFLAIDGILFLKIVAPIWVLFRVVDLFMGGPSSRRRPRSASAPHRMTADIELGPEEWTRAGPDWRRQPR